MRLKVSKSKENRNLVGGVM